jgi:NifU-like protein involved in Fe-S cluster formation
LFYNKYPERNGMAYSQNVLDHYENPRNVGSFDKTDTDVGTGMVDSMAKRASKL